MSSVTTWNRLEPVPRTEDLVPGLRAEIADPLWLLARQWQFGELTGEDAGSPVEAIVSVDAAEVSRLRLGPLTGGTLPIDLEDWSLPLEPAIERRPLAGHPSDYRLRRDAGGHVARLLRATGAGAAVPIFARAFPFEPDQGDPAAVWLAENVPDGRRLAEAILPRRGGAAMLESLPPDPPLPPTLRAPVLHALTAYLDWWDALVLEPPRGAEAWTTRRLEYGASLFAQPREGERAFHIKAEEYPGGHLDWYAFDVDPRPDPGPPPSVAKPPRELVRRMMPARAYYSGMPGERFWEFEDETVRLFVGKSGRADIAHMLLNEFALSFGNDWYVVPLALPVGSICTIRDIKVRDSFGLETAVPRTSADGSGWSMFELSEARAGAGSSGLFFLAPILGVSHEAEPIEEVFWFRDEMANLAWAVERRTEAPLGGHIDRQEAASRAHADETQRVEPDHGDATLVYRLSTTVPENWFPLVPIRTGAASAAISDLQMQPIRRFGPDGSSRVDRPSGRILTSASPLLVAEEEVPREGVQTILHWQLTRGTDGRYHSWLSYRTNVGHGEGSSGLAFDVVRGIAKEGGQVT